MPRTEETNQRIREEQKKRILVAATSLFARKGFTDTKMTDIAAAAEISYGLAYHYFTNKEEIFTRLVERALSGALSLNQRALERPGTPWDRIHWLVSVMLPGLQEEPETSMVVLQALTDEAVPQELREMAIRQTNLFQNTLKQLIIDGQAAGQVISGDPDRLVTLFSCTLQGLAIGATFSNYLSFVFPSVEDMLRILKP